MVGNTNRATVRSASSQSAGGRPQRDDVQIIARKQNGRQKSYQPPDPEISQAVDRPELQILGEGAKIAA